jgi:dihydroxy-acid dehydratase
MTQKIKPEQLRSARWFAPDDLRSFGHRSRAMQLGYAKADWEGKPVIAILNTWSDLGNCHGHFRERVVDIKRGVLQAGGFPVEIPVMSVAENFTKPTSMLYRNLLAMEVEESLRSYPIDGAVLMGGCDKTTPALWMGALSMNLPAIYVPAGAMLRGNWKGKTLGSGADAWKYWDERRAGNITAEDWTAIEEGIGRSHGTCMVMGTAATMMGITEALGLCLPGASSIPAVDSNHPRMCAASGRRIVDMVWEQLTPSSFLTRHSFENAVTVAMAEGCSTNAIIHLVAMSRRAGLPVTLDDFDAYSRRVPVIANIRPSGSEYLMEDFYYAGGMRALMKTLLDGGLLHPDTITVTGNSVAQNLQGAQVINDEVIRPLGNPIYKEGALAVLRGNLCPNGAVIKPSACSSKFQKHSGPAIVFDDYPALKRATDDPNLDITEEHVIILRNAGPQGGPGMPEWGMIPIPTKLVKQGVRDMLRISDARMSGTSYGACVLHVSPESFVGGPLALVRTGDIISVDIPNRTLNVNIIDDELARRRAAWTPPPQRFERGYGHMFSKHVLQAHEGCDFDYLETGFGAPVAEPVIY